MPPTFALRPARPEDGDAVAAMCAALARHEGGPVPGLTSEIFRRDGFGPDARFRCIMAESHGRPAGYVIHVPDYDTDLLCHSAYLADLYVDSRARGCGIGRALMAAVARAAAEQGARTMWWGVLRANDLARRFYRRLGEELADEVVCGTDGAGFARLAATPPPGGLTLRQATAADVGTLEGMLRALLAGEGIVPPATDVAQRLAAHGFGARPAFACHLAERAGAAGPEAVGYALHWPVYDTELAAPGVYLSDVYVAPEARRSGVARALLAAAARHGRAQGARYMEWKVRQENAEARAFYRSLACEYPELLHVISVDLKFSALAADGAPIG